MAIMTNLHKRYIVILDLGLPAIGSTELVTIPAAR
jgi:hypothetical protein